MHFQILQNEQEYIPNCVQKRTVTHHLAIHRLQSGTHGPALLSEYSAIQLVCLGPEEKATEHRCTQLKCSNIEFSLIVTLKYNRM